MSTQSAKDFIEHANGNEAVRKTARERYGDIAGVGKENGYDFTKDEFDQAIRERKATHGDASTEGVCQCGGPTTCQGGGESEACQCGPDYKGDSTTCQCGPDYKGESTTCQCGPDYKDESTTCQCGGDGGKDPKSGD
jgi:hypothetical protein